MFIVCVTWGVTSAGKQILCFYRLVVSHYIKPKILQTENKLRNITNIIHAHLQILYYSLELVLKKQRAQTDMKLKENAMPPNAIFLKEGGKETFYSLEK